jgi:hypothetical protein
VSTLRGLGLLRRDVVVPKWVQFAANEAVAGPPRQPPKRTTQRAVAWWAPGDPHALPATFLSPPWWRGVASAPLTSTAAAGVAKVVAPASPPQPTGPVDATPLRREFAVMDDGSLVEMTMPDWDAPWKNAIIGTPFDYASAMFIAPVEHKGRLEAAIATAKLSMTPRGGGDTRGVAAAASLRQVLAKRQAAAAAAAATASPQPQATATVAGVGAGAGSDTPEAARMAHGRRAGAGVGAR